MSNSSDSMRERVMFVERSALDGEGGLKQGFSSGAQDVYALILNNHQYETRFELETDPSRKQPIPYVVVFSERGIFCMARKSAQTEARLHGKLSIGVGGHISEETEFGQTDAIQSGMWRELHEELHINGAQNCRFRGVLNDDSNDVGQVHIGLVFTVHAEADRVSVRETEKMEGFWLSLDELLSEKGRLESWSALLLQTLPEWVSEFE